MNGQDLPTSKDVIGESKDVARVGAGGGAVYVLLPPASLATEPN